MYKYLALLIIGVIPSIAFGIDNAVFTKDDEKIINQYFKESFGDKADDASKVFASLHNQKTGIDSQGMKAVCISGLTKEQTVKFDCEKMWANIIDKTHPEKAKGEKVTTDAEFAKLCKEYGHDAYIDEEGDCFSDESIRVSKISDIKVKLESLIKYWKGKGYSCEEQYSFTGDSDNTINSDDSNMGGDYVRDTVFYYQCEDKKISEKNEAGGHIVITPEVVVSKSVCGEDDYGNKMFLSVDTKKCSAEPNDVPLILKSLCGGYEYSHDYDEGSYHCPPNNELDVTVDTVEELYTKLDEFAEYWLENGFNCEYYGEVEGNQLVSWVSCFMDRDSASVVPWGVSVVTPNVKIANPCAAMGDKAKFDYSDKVCHCKAYYEKKNGKCEEMACSENRYFDREYDNGCRECSDNQRSKAGENVCSSFECPTDYQEGREHMCLWKTTNTELIDDYGPNGLKLELKSVQDGINRIRQDDEYFKSCNCSAEDGTPHMLYGSTDYISCNCKDEKGRLKTFRFSFTDLSDWNGK